MTPPKSRADYVNDFKQQNATKYTNSFKTEPSVRPTYIPQTYNNHTIIYNSTYGGYGYMDAVGTWIMFDALEHAAHHSYVGYQNTYAAQPVVVTSSGSSWLAFFIFLVILVAVFAILSNRRNSYY